MAKPTIIEVFWAHFAIAKDKRYTEPVAYAVRATAFFFGIKPEKVMQEVKKAYHINDRERTMWVTNTESLWQLFRRSHMTMREFVKEYRELIDSYILTVLTKKK